MHWVTRQFRGSVEYEGVQTSDGALTLPSNSSGGAPVPYPGLRKRSGEAACDPDGSLEPTYAGGASSHLEGMLDRLAHRAREPRFAQSFGRDPEMPSRRAALEHPCVDRQGQRKMSEGLFDRPRQPAPAERRPARGSPTRRVAPRRSMACPAARPSRRAAHAVGGGGRGRRRRNGERNRPPLRAAAWPSPLRGAGRPPASRSGTPRSLARAGRTNNRDCAAGRSSLQCPSAPGRNRPPARRQHPRRRPRFRLSLAQAAHRARSAAPGRGRYCRQPARFGARRRSPRSPRRYRRDAGQSAQVGFLGRKSAAAARDFLCAGVEVSRPRIIAKAGERADHGLDRSSGKVLHPRPFGCECLVVGRRRLGRGLLEQDFGQPYPVRIGRLARRRAPGQRAAIAIPPAKRPGHDRLLLCLPSQRAYIGAHAVDPTPHFFPIFIRATLYSISQLTACGAGGSGPEGRLGLLATRQMDSLSKCIFPLPALGFLRPKSAPRLSKYFAVNVQRVE